MVDGAAAAIFFASSTYLTSALRLCEIVVPWKPLDWDFNWAASRAAMCRKLGSTAARWTRLMMVSDAALPDCQWVFNNSEGPSLPSIVAGERDGAGLSEVVLVVCEFRAELRKSQMVWISSNQRVVDPPQYLEESDTSNPLLVRWFQAWERRGLEWSRSCLFCCQSLLGVEYSLEV